MDGGHGREGAGECSGAVPSWNALPSSVLCRWMLLGIGAARSPSAPCRSLGYHWGFWVSPLNLGMFPCCASPPEDPPFRGWFAPIPAPHYLPEMIFCLCVPALSHLFKDVTAHPAAMFSHLSVPTGVSFLQSEQSSEPCGLPTEQRISLAIGAPLKCREAAETP